MADSTYSYPLPVRIPEGAQYGRGPSDHLTQTSGGTGWQHVNGYDRLVASGTPVFAVSDGTIDSNPKKFGRYTGIDPNLTGCKVTINGDDGDDIFYQHLVEYAPGIEPGASVKAGQIIGYSGVGGGVPHLHIADSDGNIVQILKDGQMPDVAQTQDQLRQQLLDQVDSILQSTGPSDGDAIRQDLSALLTQYSTTFKYVGMDAGLTSLLEDSAHAGGSSPSDVVASWVAESRDSISQNTQQRLMQQLESLILQSNADSDESLHDKIVTFVTKNEQGLRSSGLWGSVAGIVLDSEAENGPDLKTALKQWILKGQNPAAPLDPDKTGGDTDGTPDPDTYPEPSDMEPGQSGVPLPSDTDDGSLIPIQGIIDPSGNPDMGANAEPALLDGTTGANPTMPGDGQSAGTDTFPPNAGTDPDQDPATIPLPGDDDPTAPQGIPDDGQLSLASLRPSQAPDADAPASFRYFTSDGTASNVPIFGTSGGASWLMPPGQFLNGTSGESNDQPAVPNPNRSSLFGGDPFGTDDPLAPSGPTDPLLPAAGADPIANMEPHIFGGDDFGSDLSKPLGGESDDDAPMPIQPPPSFPPLPEPEPIEPVEEPVEEATPIASMEPSEPEMPSFEPSEPMGAEIAAEAPI